MIRIDRTYKRVVIGTWMVLALLIMPLMIGSAFAQEVGSNIINGSGNATTSTVGAITSTITNTNGAGNQNIGTIGGAPGSSVTISPTNTNTNTNVNVNDLSNKQHQNQHQNQAQQQQQKQQQGQQQGQANDQTISPSQTIVGAPNLIQLPGFVGAYPNFTQPYKPDVFINGAGPVRPVTMTYAQAKACDGTATDNSGKSIKLYYPQWDKVAPAGDFSGYVGSVRVEEKDGFWIEAVCEGARKAMDKGASEGVVEYVIRPVNRTWGIGGSASFGGSGMPVAGANPYALAGAVGLGMGVSGAYVKGELMLTVTGFKSGNVKSARIEEGGSGPRPVSLSVTEPGRMNLRPEVLIQTGQ